MESIQDRPRWFFNEERTPEDRSSNKYHQMLGRRMHEHMWEETRAKKKDAGRRETKNKDVGHKGQVDADKGRVHKG